MRKLFLIPVLGIATLFSGSVFAQPAPTATAITIPVQGLLTSANGAPLADVAVRIRFRLYRTGAISNHFWEGTYDVRVGNIFPGVFSVRLTGGSPNLTDLLLMNNPTPHMSMRVGNEDIGGRWPIDRTPFAAFSNLAGESSGGNGIPTGGIVFSATDNDTRLTGAGFTRLPLTVEATCDMGADCSMIGGSSGPIPGSGPQPNWGSARVESRRSSPVSFIWGNGDGVRDDGRCSGGGSFYVYSRRRTPYRYCQSSNSWHSYPSAPGDYGSRYAYAAAGMKHSDNNYYFHVVGGNSPSRRHDIYNPRSNRWTTGRAYPSSRYCLRGAVLDNKWYVFGGSSSGGNSSPVCDYYEYTPENNQWRRRGCMPMGRRAEHMVAATRDRVYVISGKLNNGLTSRMDSWNPENNQWRQRRDFVRRVTSPQGRGLGGRVVVHGGSGNGGSATGCGPCYNNYLSYNPDNNNWQNHGNGGSRSAGGTAFASAGRIGDCVYIAGGEPWQSRLDRICVSNSRVYDDTWEGEGSGGIALRAYQAP